MTKTKVCFVLSEHILPEEMNPENADIRYIKIQLIKTITMLVIALCFILSVKEIRILAVIGILIGLLIRAIIFD
jgi:hypothetical protein